MPAAGPAGFKPSCSRPATWWTWWTSTSTTTARTRPKRWPGNDLQPEIDKMRGWLRQSASQRANQVAFGVSEWGNYNNSYPIGDGLYAADLMGQMAQSQ